MTTVDKLIALSKSLRSCNALVNALPAIKVSTKCLEINERAYYNTKNMLYMIDHKV